MTGWTLGEKNFVATAAALAPSVHNTAPWTLEFHDDGHAVSLYERLDRTLPRHDPLGRDRLISCGAALEHVLVAVRVLGWAPDLVLRPDPTHPDEVGRVTADRRTPTSDVDRERWRAISSRHSYRRRFAGRAVDAGSRASLAVASDVDGVGVRPVTGTGEFAALARLLHHAALVLRTDRAYQRELSAWTAPTRDPLPGEGVSAATRRTATLPWAGLVRRTTAIPDAATLTDRLSGEFLLLVETPDDGRFDQVRAGMAHRGDLARRDGGRTGRFRAHPAFPAARGPRRAGGVLVAERVSAGTAPVRPHGRAPRGEIRREVAARSATVAATTSRDRQACDLWISTLHMRPACQRCDRPPP